MGLTIIVILVCCVVFGLIIWIGSSAKELQKMGLIFGEKKNLNFYIQSLTISWTKKVLVNIRAKKRKQKIVVVI